ncbi:MAG: hypothetical protein AAF961_13350 [Planctomycetota bacterium]
MLTTEDLMQSAIEAAWRGIAAGQSPFGARLGLDGVILTRDHDTAAQSTDITAHAGIHPSRAAQQTVSDGWCSGVSVATTYEPLPACKASLPWAVFSWSIVERFYLGASTDAAATDDFNELRMAANQLAADGGISSTSLAACWRRNAERSSTCGSATTVASLFNGRSSEEF